jgi:hypothetical protein
LGIAIALQHFASLGVLCGQANEAARLIGYVNAQYAELGSKREYTENWGYERLIAALREQMTADEIEKLEAEGATWSEDRVVEQVMSL